MAAIARVQKAQTLGAMLAVTHVVGAGYQRLGYSMTARGPAGDFAVYAEQSLPADRRVSIAPTNPAAKLYVAIYYGSTQSPQALLRPTPPSATRRHPRLPVAVLRGRHFIWRCRPGGRWRAGSRPRADGSHSRRRRHGDLLVAALVGVLARQRRRAERQAAQSRRVAETLQRSLLPARLPEFEGVDLVARYQAATDGVSVGGDWYDAVEVDEDCISRSATWLATAWKRPLSWDGYVRPSRLT